MNGNTTKKGRTIRLFSLVLGILLVVLIVMFLGLRTNFFARGAGRLATKHFLRGTPFSISIEKLEGSLVQDVTVKGLKIHYREGDESFDLFRADELSCRYDLLTLMRREPRIKEISLTKPMLRLKADSAGTFILPSLGGGKGDFPALEVGRFSSEEGHVLIQGLEKSDAVSGVNLVGSIRSGGKELEVRIWQGAADDADRNFVMKSLKGGILLRKGEALKASTETPATRVYLDSLAVVLDESAFTVDGMIVPGTMLFDCGVSAEPIAIGEITRILQVETSHYGEIKGTFTARGKPGRFRLTGVMNGVVSGYALSDFGIDMLRDGGLVRLDSLGGTLNGARVEGKGSYTIGAPNVLSLALDVGDLDLARGFVPKKELPETRFNGAVAMSYRIDDGLLAFSLDLGEGDFKGFPFARAVARGSYANDTLEIAELRIDHPTHVVNARGRFIGADSISFVFNLECAARDTLFAYFDIEDYRADLALNGMWEGTLDAWDMRMSGACRNLAYRQGFVPEGEMKLAIEKEGDFRVFFDIDGPGCRIGPASFSKLSLSLEYQDSVTTVKRLKVSRSDFAADVTLDVRLGREGTSIQFRECSLDAFDETWVGGGNFSILVGDSLVRFDDIQLHSRTGAAFVDGAYDTKRKTVDGSFSFERLGLDLLNRAKLLAMPFEGRANGKILCAGSIADPDLAIDIVMNDGRIDTILVDSLRARARYSKGRWAVDTLAIASPEGAVGLRGELTGVPIGELRRRNRDTLDHAIIAIEASCDNLAIVHLLSLGGVKAFSEGRLSGAIALTDSLVHPLIAFKGTIRDLSAPSFRIPAIDCDLELDREKLAVGGSFRMSSKQEGSFHGTLPLIPARFLYALDRVRPVSFEVDLPEGDLAGLSEATDLITEAAGRYSVQLMATGTIVEPHLYGDLQLTDASFRVSGMEEKYYAVNATVLLEDTLVTISKFNAKEGKKGTLGCAGWIALRGWRPATYNLSVSANEFVLASLSNILAILSGTLNVTTKIEGGRTLPALAGSFEVKKSEVSYDLGSLSSPEGGGTLESPSWEAAIDLKIPGNSWIITPDARVEMQGNVTLYHDGRGTYMRGELNLVRGWYNIYNNKFRIISGKLQFVHAGALRPIVDIEAETRDPEGRTIYLTIQWHQDDVEPRLTLRHEDPGYSETDIWKMLGGGVVSNAESAGASWDARNTAQNLAANFIESVLNSQMQGVTIELEAGATAKSLPGTGDYRDTKIAIGKYLSEGLYVKYKQGLSISSARQIEVEYRISDLFLIRSEVIRYSEKVLQGKSPRSSDEINVDVKLRWEF